MAWYLLDDKSVDGEQIIVEADSPQQARQKCRRVFDQEVRVMCEVTSLTGLARRERNCSCG